MASCVIKCDHNVRNGKQEVNIMWTSQSMTLLESLTVSAMGLTVVLGVLSMLAIAIVLFSKLLNLGGKKRRHLRHHSPQGRRAPPRRSNARSSSRLSARSCAPIQRTFRSKASAGYKPHRLGGQFLKSPAPTGKGTGLFAISGDPGLPCRRPRAC